MIKRLSLFLCFVALSGIIAGQGSPLHFWGKVDSQEREMTHYEKEPEANAVILSDYCSVKFKLTRDGWKTVYIYHVKMKLFNKDAFDYADIMIPYYAKKGNELVKNIKAHTINVENGKLVTTELKKSDFFTEDLNEYYKAVKFTFPDLREGSIIEYQYQRESSGIFDIDTWYFQSDLPIMWSEIRVGIPNYFQYTYVIYKTQELAREDFFEDSFSLGDYNVSGITYVFAHRGVPSMKEEPYITTMTDYLQRVDFQLSVVRFPNEPADSIMTSWSRLGKNLTKHNDIGKQISARRNFNNLEKAALPLVAGVDNDAKKLQILYDYILENIDWNGRQGVLASEPIDDAFKAGSGNGAVLNYALIALLRQLEIEAWPVLVSTRENGAVQKLHPIVNQFDHVIGCATIDGKPFLFDIRNDFRPSTLIARECLNGIGFLLDGDTSRWIDINSEISKSHFNTLVQIKDGQITGKMKSRHSNYDALSIRSEVERNTEEEYLSSLMKNDPSFDADSVSFDNLDDRNKLLVQTVHFSSEEDEFDSDFIYLNPIIGESWIENPFSLEQRNYPVDMAHTFDETYMFNMQLPEGYQVDEIPTNIRISLFGDAGFFEYLTTQSANLIQIKSVVRFKRAVFSPGEYKDLKEFFDTIVAKHEEQIVIKKSP